MVSLTNTQTKPYLSLPQPAPKLPSNPLPENAARVSLVADAAIGAGAVAGLTAISLGMSIGKAALMTAPLFWVSIGLGVIALLLIVGGLIAKYRNENANTTDTLTLNPAAQMNALPSAPPRDMPPATEATLQINGISVLVRQDQNMAFPTGHVVPMGQPGDISQYTPSEAFGYAMRNAVAANDKAFFQQLLNGYLYLTNQTTIYRSTVQGISGNQLAVGLIGWSPNVMNVMSNKLPYDPALPTSFVSAASDADADVIAAMIDAAQKWPDLTAQDALSQKQQGVLSQIDLTDLTTTAITSFVNNDIGSYSFNNKNYNPVMSLDNWGHDALFPDYFDPTTFAKMIAFVEANEPGSSLVQTLQSAAQTTLQYVQDVAARQSGWIPDSPYSTPGQPSNFGYDAVRILMRFGEYLNGQGDPLQIKDKVRATLATLVENIFSNNYLQWQNGTAVFTPSGLNLGQFTGPLLVALNALNNTGELPPGVTQQDIANTKAALAHDLTQYNTNSMQNWQQNYFAIQLALLSQSLV